MQDVIVEKFDSLNKKELEKTLSSLLMEKCGCYAELTAIALDPNTSIHEWDVGEITFKVKRFGRVRSPFAG